MVLLEVCVDSVASALAAEAAGARRLELCDGLVDGGVTPSAGKIAIVRGRVGIPVHVLIRPRGGDFVYTDDEVDVMLHDVGVAKRAGCHGVVLGALTPDGRVDAPVVKRLVEAARPLAVTFHRAVDVCRDAVEAVRVCAAVGVDRVLTSGGCATAPEGAATVRAMVEAAGAGVTVIAGGGVRPDNVADLVAATGVREVHATARQSVASRSTFRKDPPVYMGAEKRNTPEAEYTLRQATVGSVTELLRALPGAK